MWNVYHVWLLETVLLGAFVYMSLVNGLNACISFVYILGVQLLRFCGHCIATLPT